MTFTWDISIGQLIQAALFLLGVYGGVMRIYHLLDTRMHRVELMLKQHADHLEDHATRMDRYEASFLRVVGDLQRVIGRMEAGTAWTTHDPDRRVPDRS